MMPQAIIKDAEEVYPRTEWTLETCGEDPNDILLCTDEAQSPDRSQLR
jgi:hypothetical protein